MTNLPKLILGVLTLLFESKAWLEAENLIPRQKINVLRRRIPKSPHPNTADRFLFVWLYRWFPPILGALAIVRPETIIRRPNKGTPFRRVIQRQGVITSQPILGGLHPQ